METNQAHLSPEEALFQQMVQAYQAKNWQQVIALSVQLKGQVQHLESEQIIQYYDFLGKSLKNEQRYEEAMSVFNALIREFPSTHLGVEGLIQLAQVQKNWAQVIKLAMIFQKYFPQMWQGYWYEASARKEMQQWEQAKSLFHHLKHHFPEYKFGLQGLIQIAQQNQNWHEVIELSTKFQEKFPQFWEGWHWKGHAHRQLQQLDAAQAEFETFQQHFPQQHQALEGMINVAQSKQQWQKVVDLSAQFQAAHPNMWQGWWWKGQAHRNLQQFDAATSEFFELNQRFPQQHTALEGMINIAQSQQNWEYVIELSEQFKQQFPHMWQSWWWKGNAYIALQDFDAAAAEFSELQTHFPNQHHALEGAIKISQAQQNWSDVLILCAQFQKDYPNLWLGWWWKGHAHRHLQEFDDADHEFMALIRQFPNVHYGLEGLINNTQSRQNWQRVADLSEQFKQRYAHMWQGWWWQIEAFHKLQQHDKVETELAQFAELFPTHHARLQRHLAQQS